jgi:hypothetical protein
MRALRQHAGAHRRNLDRDLVRLELDQRVTWRNRIAFFFQPPLDGCFDDRLSQRRNLDGGHETLNGAVRN